MKAIILAAGLGRRMQPLTDDRHKSLLDVGDTTIMGRIVDALVRIDVTKILVVTGYRAEDVRAFLDGTYPSLSFEYVHNERYRETNNIVSLAMALEKTQFDDDVILIESDVLFDGVLLERLAARTGNVALVDRYRPGMDGTVVAVEGGIITGVFPPHLQGEDFHYGDKFKTLNIYRFDREFCRRTFQPLLSCYANLIDEHCYYELVLGMLVNMQREKIHAEIVDGDRWSEVDDPNDLQVARFVFDPERRLEILDRNKGGLWNFDVLDFCWLRNMYFPTDAMLASMRQALPQLVRNYGSAQPILNAKLAGLLLCRPERVQLLHGAAQLFPLAAEWFGAKAPLLPAPTFGEFPRWFPGARSYADAPGIDLDQIETRLPEHDLCVLVNPNNPTGTTLSTERLHAMMARHPRVRFLVDESFVDFSTEEPILSRLERQPLDHVVVLASLSKTLGVPGLRLGYAYSSDAAFVRALGERLPIWNANSLSEYFLEICLKFRGERAGSFTRSAADRDSFAALLGPKRWAAEVYPSGGNFLLVRLSPGVDAARLTQRLVSEARIYVKDAGEKLTFPSLRLAVRLPHENQRLVETIDRMVGNG
jgi:histidinol-phosphate/aromatic aminotransferase/cobyric acid decarboxylase-like protein/choline kinase